MDAGRLFTVDERTLAVVEFTVSKLTIEPCGTDVHLFIQEPLAGLIGQLCEDGREEEITTAVEEWKAAWKAEQETES